MSDSTFNVESVKQSALARLPGADPALIDMEMRWVAHEFMSETRLWRRTMDITLLPLIRDYAIPIEDYETVTLLKRSAYGERELGNGIPTPDTNEGSPRFVGLLNDRTARVYPLPGTEQLNTTITLDLCASVLPVLDVPLPDEIRPYNQALLDGLLARMLGMADKPWTDQRMALYHRQEFVRAFTMTRREMEKDRTFGFTMARMNRAGM